MIDFTNFIDFNGVNGLFSVNLALKAFLIIPSFNLACQSNSALGSPSVNYSSSSLGGHAFAKSMVSGSFSFARLKSTFHLFMSLFDVLFLILS